MTIGVCKSLRVSKGRGRGRRSNERTQSSGVSGVQNSFNENALQEVLVQNDEV